MSVIIKAENLSCQSGRHFLVHQINWTVHSGDHWILFGMNGCGKTTLLSIIAGFKGYTQGKLEVFGQAYNEENIFKLRKRIGWVSSSFFDKYLSWESALSIILSGVSGTLSMSKEIQDEDVKQAIALLKEFRLGGKIDQPFALMSKGERQCVLLARALISRPELLILDEPGTGLDIYAREYVLRAIDDLAKYSKMTIIYVTHYAEEILPTFDQTMLMREGRIYKVGKTADLFTNEIFSDFMDYQATVNQQEGAVSIKMDIGETIGSRFQANDWRVSGDD